MVSMVTLGKTLECGNKDQKQEVALFSNDKSVTFCQFYGKEESIRQDAINQEESSLAVRTHCRQNLVTSFIDPYL